MPCQSFGVVTVSDYAINSPVNVEPDCDSDQKLKQQKGRETPKAFSSVAFFARLQEEEPKGSVQLPTYPKPHAIHIH